MLRTSLVSQPFRNELSLTLCIRVSRVPDNDPMDCGGHGSHVAGIVAADMNPCVDVKGY